jgi:hypothetical protein
MMGRIECASGNKESANKPFIKNGKLVCTRCGRRTAVGNPIAVLEDIAIRFWRDLHVSKSGKMGNRPTISLTYF